MTDSKDIYIGETERIAFVYFDSAGKDLFDVDYIVAKYHDFWSFLELECVPECCGIDAFRFYPEDIVHAAKQVDSKLLKADLLELKSDLVNSQKDIIESERLNNLLDKSVFIKLLDHIIRHVPGAS